MSLWINYLISLCQNSFTVKEKVSHFPWLFLWELTKHAFPHTHCKLQPRFTGILTMGIFFLHVQFSPLSTWFSWRSDNLPGKQLSMPSASVNLVVSFFNLSCCWDQGLTRVREQGPQNTCCSAIFILVWDDSVRQ